MIKVNDIFLPNDQVELETQDLKKWLKYCKLQDKRFKTVVDTVGEYRYLEQEYEVIQQKN